MNISITISTTPVVSPVMNTEDNATMSDNEDNATMGDESAEGAGTAERGDAVGLERDLGDEADELSTDSLRVDG